MIELMLGAMVVAGWLMTVPKALAEANAVRRASKAGAWDYLRDREKYRAARAKAWAARRRQLARESGITLPDTPADATPGFRAYAAHHYRAFWAKKLAKAQAKPAGPAKQREPLSQKANRLANRLDAAIVDKAKRVVNSKPVQKLVQPVGEPRPEQADSIHHERAYCNRCDWVGPWRTGPEDPAQDALRHRCPDGFKPEVDFDVEPPSEAEQRAEDEAHEEDTRDWPASDRQDHPETPNNNGGNSMTAPVNTPAAPTGEAVNYETHMVELDAQEAQFQALLDSADAATRAAVELKARADDMQQRARTIHAAAQTKLDNLSARGMDADTMIHAAAAVEAVDPNTVNALYEQVEVLEQQAADTRTKAEAGLASVAAERATIVAKYGDAHVTVASELGGDSSYLDSAGTPAAGQTVNA